MNGFEFLTAAPFRLVAGGLALVWLWRLYRQVLPARGGRLLALGLALGAVSLLAFRWAALAILLLAALGQVAWWWRGRGRARAVYAPVQARFEGGGIKRGLTAPEVAVLLGRPMNLILGVALAEMLQKGLLVQEQAAPLLVRPAEELLTRKQSLNIERRAELRRAGAQKVGATLHPFEEPLLELIEQQSDVPIRELDFGLVAGPLVGHVARRVAGYDLAETRTYYELILRRAPTEARTEGILQTDRQKVFDRNFGWILLGADFASVFDQADYSYRPKWLYGGGLPEGETFANWFGGVVAELQGGVAADDLRLKLGQAVDAVAASLMADIAQATYYG